MYSFAQALFLLVILSSAVSGEEQNSAIMPGANVDGIPYAAKEGIKWETRRRFHMSACLKVRPEKFCAEPLKDDYQVGDEFQDCVWCPVMVVVPQGSFMMGSTKDERQILQEKFSLDLQNALETPKNRKRIQELREEYGDAVFQRAFSEESPQREVTISMPYAMGKYEITFDEWDACLRFGGCDVSEAKFHTSLSRAGSDYGWGRVDRPVILVNWYQAGLYYKWISKFVGRDYRFPSEAEWEYAARAGTTTLYSWGNDADRNRANYGSEFFGMLDGAPNGNDQWETTAPVGQFEANSFGLHDMHGNVGEWTSDLWAESYADVPVNGSPFLGNKSLDPAASYQRVFRGGTWSDASSEIRSASRSAGFEHHELIWVGFRAVRELQ